MGKIFGRGRFRVFTSFGIVIMLGVFVASGFYFWQKDSEGNVDKTLLQTESIVDIESRQQETPKETQSDQVPQPSPVFDAQQLQGIIDDWANGLSGESSVEVFDPNGITLAAYNADQDYFAASLYKLYVAYFGYKQIDDGVVSRDEPFRGSRTRAECLDAMIRESDSPCAEKMWAELGKQELTDSLTEMGISNTSMTNLSTTAGDVARILSLFSNSEGLSDVSQAAFLASAKDQIFRDALNKGLSSPLTVYNKIGFNELKEYHDAAIVELPDGRRFIITVLTENVGTRNIAELARRIEAVILE